MDKLKRGERVEIFSYPSILFWDLRRQTPRERGWACSMVPSILFWDLPKGLLLDLLRKVEKLYTFNSLLRSSRRIVEKETYVYVKGTFNSLLRSSPFSSLIVVSHWYGPSILFWDLPSLALKLALQMLYNTFNSLLRSSGCFGFIWVFKFYCLF